MTAHSSPPSPLTAEEIASVRRPFRGARLLPGRAYHEPAIYEWERTNVLAVDWVIVGRASEAGDPGTYFVTELDGESIVVVRGRDGELRAFYNVCRHRGTAVVEEPCGTAVRFQCPYHAWIYDLEGKLVRAKHTEDLDDFSPAEYSLAPIRLEAWQGFVFLNLNADAAPLADQLGDLPDHVARFDFAALRPARTIEYDVAANWKFIAENYSECYHCPGLHPQLNKLTPYDIGVEYETNGAWQGGWMEFSDGVETMALDGGQGSRRGRPAIAGMPAKAVEDEQGGTDADRAVGDVERRPRPAAVVEEQKVGHAADHDPVPEIAERAAKDQRESGAHEAAAAALQHPHEERTGDDGDPREQPPLPAVGARQETERRTGVIGEHEAEKGGHRQLLSFAEQCDDPRLGGEVEHDHGGGQQQPPPPRTRRRHGCDKRHISLHGKKATTGKRSWSPQA